DAETTAHGIDAHDQVRDRRKLHKFIFGAQKDVARERDVEPATDGEAEQPFAVLAGGAGKRERHAWRIGAWGTAERRILYAERRAHNIDIGVPDGNAGESIGQEIAQRPAATRPQRAEIEIADAAATGNGDIVGD